MIDDDALVFVILALAALACVAGVIWRLYVAAVAPRDEDENERR